MTENKYALLTTTVQDYDYFAGGDDQPKTKVIADIIQNNFDGTYQRVVRDVVFDKAKELVAKLNG